MPLGAYLDLPEIFGTVAQVFIVISVVGSPVPDTGKVQPSTSIHQQKSGLGSRRVGGARRRHDHGQRQLGNRVRA
jgi:hypothetical protein